MQIIDWVVVAAYLIFALGVGVFFARRAGSGIEEYFLSGRSLPWWVAGTSMVATSFAADTPLAVTELVRQYGIAGNWFWWTYAIGGMLSALLFARFWRRAGVLTDAELTEIRYDGRGAAILRGFRGFYFATIRNCLVMGWVILAMATLVSTLFPGFDKGLAVALSCAIALTYAVLSGFWGVVVTDLVQFALAMTGAIATAFFSVREVGGMKAMQSGLLEAHGAGLTSFLPSLDGSSFLPMSAFLIYVFFLWWCTDNADGGGMIIQRMSASKNENEALKATVWFNFAHYGLRTWPWVLTALASLILFPDLTDDKLAYPQTALTVLPAVWKGILVASILAAFMSTIDTHLNWGASYLVNDIYRRFLRPDASMPGLVLVSRISTVLLMVLGGIIALQYSTITGAWILTLSLGAGAGVVYVLRWVWWRVNAWSELSAMIASILVNIVLRVWFPDLKFPYSIPVVVFASAAIWIPVTFLTSPVGDERLHTFVARVRPVGFWSRFRPVDDPNRLGRWLFLWVVATAALYGFLFGGGAALFGRWGLSGVCFAISILGGWYLFRSLDREGWF